MEAMQGSLLIGITMILGPTINGWALSVLWGWFIAPTFGLSKLSVPMAMGLAVVVRMFMPTDFLAAAERKQVSMSGAVGMVIGGAIIAPLGAVGFGWIVKQFL